MDGLSLIVLADTLDRITELAKPEDSSGMLDCVTAVRGYTELCAIDPTNSGYPQKLRAAVTDLARIVEDKRQFFLASRLAMIKEMIPALRS